MVERDARSQRQEPLGDTSTQVVKGTSTMAPWFNRHPRFTLHFRRTCRSWLNLVERWFAD
jgi:hypothetical protein